MEKKNSRFKLHIIRALLVMLALAEFLAVVHHHAEPDLNEKCQLCRILIMGKEKETALPAVSAPVLLLVWRLDDGPVTFFIRRFFIPQIVPHAPPALPLS